MLLLPYKKHKYLQVKLIYFMFIVILLSKKKQDYIYVLTKKWQLKIVYIETNTMLLTLSF